MDENLGASFQKLVYEVTGDFPVFYGGSFNIHYMTSNTFIKVTRPWVKPARAVNELYAASSLHASGFPVARPFRDELFTFVDPAGKMRYVTFWERLTPERQLTREEGTLLSAEWINKLWKITPPENIHSFVLDDFLHAVEVRLQDNTHELTPRLLSEVKEVVASIYSRPIVDYGFIHGDFHNENILMTTEGLKIIDWESSCIGPREWDAAQNIRFANPMLRDKQWDFWRTQNINEELTRFYFHVRSLSTLSHLVATGLRPPIFYQSLIDLNWD